eukprot:gene20178-60039_t
MLANDCWGGMMDKRIAALTALELSFLLPLRTVRRRWYCPGPHGTPGMPSVLGHSTVAPCMSGAKEALRWPVDGDGKVSVPSRNAERMRPFVEFVLPRPLRVKGAKEDRTRDELRAALLKELERHEWARGSRQRLREGAECMAECAPGGFVRVDDEALGQGLVPEWLLELMVDPDPAEEEVGPADATADADAPLAQQVRDAGLDSQLRVPGAGDEADPCEVVSAAAQKLEAALKEIAAARDGKGEGEGEGRHATKEEVGQMARDLSDALQSAERTAAKAAADRDRRLVLHGDRIEALPAGDDLASLWDWRTWWASSWALWPYGDLTPYFHDRVKPMTLRQHFAYVMDREELVYPLADGSTPPPVEPPRWRGARIGTGHGSDHGAQDWQKQVSGARVVLQMEGFAKSAAAVKRMPPERWMEAAGEKGGRTARQALADPNVDADVKEGLKMMSIIYRHGFPVAFGTPNIQTGRNPVFAACALSPGEGSLVDEWGVGTPLVCLSDLSPALQKEWLSWGHKVAFARDPVA